MSRFFLFLLIFSAPLCAQNSDEIRRIDSIYSLSGYSIEDKIELLQSYKNSKVVQNNKNSLSYALHKEGLLFYRLTSEPLVERIEKAIFVTEKSIEVRKKTDEIDFLMMSNSLYNLNFYYKVLGDKKRQKRAILEIQKLPVKNKFTYKSIIDLSYIYSSNGDYFQALNLLRGVINSYGINYHDARTLLLAHENSIMSYSGINDSRKYKKEIEQHINSITNLVNNTALKVSRGYYNNLANIYDDQGEYKIAIEFYKKAEKINLKYGDSAKLGDIYNNLGRVYNIVGEGKAAQESFGKSLDFSSDLRSQAAVYNNQGDVLDVSIKLVNNKKAIETLLGTTYEGVPKLQDIRNSEYVIDILGYMIESVDAGTKLYTRVIDGEGINKTLQMVDLVDKLISLIRQESIVDLSKLFWIEKASKFYMNGVTLAYYSNNSSLAFYFMEKNKGLLLLEGLHKSNNEYFREPSSDKLSIKIEDYIDTKKSLVEYILNDNEGFGLFYDNDGEVFFKLNNVPQLISDIKELKIRVTEHFKTEKEKSEYVAIAKRIYKTLFPFDRSFERIEMKELIIIPDYLLQYINFETLVSNSSENYLVEDVEIRYLLSLSIANHLNQRENKSNYGVFGIAPTNFKQNNLPTLGRSSAMMNTIANLYPNKMLIGEKAKSEYFVSELEQYNMIHLNTHAGIDEIENTPWIMFHDKSLSFEEISQLRNSADLVVLDVCNGALGEQEIGEGVMSLARSFFKGGAKSVITTQWEANEKAVTEILTYFYRELSKGLTKSKSLQMAKKKYLKNHQLSEVSPYYWGTLVLTGNTDPISPQIDYFRLIWVVVVMLLIFVTSKLLISYYSDSNK